MDFPVITNGSWYTLPSGGVRIHSALLHKKPI